MVAAATLPGGGRRHLHNSGKGPVARAPGTASLVTETQGGGQKPLSPGIAVPPSTLDSANGGIKLAGSDLQSFTLAGDDAAFRNVVMPAINGTEQMSAVELEATRLAIIDYFHKTFSLFELLHEMFSDTPAFYEKHERLRHPPIFYMGHTAAFYINKLHLGKFIVDRIDPMLEMQMAVGVDEMSWDDLDSNSYVWASGEEARADPERATDFLQRVLDFRLEVRQRIDKRMQSEPMVWPITKDSFWYVILMAIEHDRIHLETSSCILRQASMSCVQPNPYFPVCKHGRFSTDANSTAAQSIPPNNLIPVETGTTRIGREWSDTKTYGWDNEFGKVSHPTVPAFSASEFLVSNKEFYDFVQDDGYAQSRFWTEEGWNWVSDMKPAAPRYWRKRDDGHYLRTLCEEIVMPWDWPVEVSHHEAAAFCKYLSEKTGKSLRLPMEDEYLRIRDGVPTDQQASAHGPSWGSDVPGNVNFAFWGSSCPVDMFRAPSGICDVLGNVWQHNLTNIDVLEGFTSHPLYDDFTTPTVCGLHSRIMGGSWMSTGAAGGTRDSRFGFRRHFYQHAGFRYIETERQVVNDVMPYERDRFLCDAFRFHFDEPEGNFHGNFHTRLANACAQTLARMGTPLKGSRVLELGCGPGRTVLEFAKRGVAVSHGGDRSAKAFQLTAQRLLGPQGRLRWINFRESELVEPRQMSVAEVELSPEAVDKVQFYQFPDYAVVDTKKFHDYDLVVCAQPGVLGMSGPVGLLNAAHKVVKPGGILAIGTQYEWSVSGEVKGVTSGEEVLSKLLFPWFEPVAKPIDLPFAMTKSARKFEIGTQHVTFWRRLAHMRDGEDFAAALAEASSIDQEDVLWKHLDSHYGPFSTYPAACARRCAEAVERLGVPFGRALEVGGGPGRAALELSRAFKHVDSGDVSELFVEAAQRLLKDGELSWLAPADHTGGRTVTRAVNAKELAPGSVSFTKLDAEVLPAELTGYDLICGFSVIDQLARPRDFLLGAKARLNKGGLLVLSSPYEWSEDLTDKDQWLGGFKYGDNDGPSTYQGLKELLVAEGFEEALQPEELEFDLEQQANGRKSERHRTQMTFWRLL